MTSHQNYHPYRFSSLAKESIKRLRLLMSEHHFASSQDMLSKAYPGSDSGEVIRRARDKSVLAAAHNAWAHDGRRVIDVSELMGQLATATAIEFNTMPEGRLPDTFHIHFGPEAKLFLNGQTEHYIAGVTATPHTSDDQHGVHLAFVRGSVAPAPVGAMTLPELLEEESAVAFVAAPKNDLFKIFSETPSGDPRICSDPVFRAATLRALVAIRHLMDPQLVEELTNPTPVGRGR